MAPGKEDSSYIEPYEARVIYTGRHSLPRHMILHYLRDKLEARHRERVYSYATMHGFLCRPKIDEPDDIPEMGIDGDVDCCNKTAPVYVCTHNSDLKTNVVTHALYRWLYKRWHVPYRDEIEFGQFIAKTIFPQNIPPGISTDELIKAIVRINDSISTKAEAKADLLRRNPAELGNLLMNHREVSNPLKPAFVFRPTFRAVAIIVDVEDHGMEFDDLGRIPVLVVRTGTDDTGLSAPITLDILTGSTDPDNRHYVKLGGRNCEAIRTSLEAAFSLITDLESRETAAFGPRPDTDRVVTGGLFRNLCVGENYYEEEARRVGWKGAFKIPVRSSQWVDRDLYPNDCGHICRNWQRIVLLNERIARKLPVGPDWVNAEV